MISLRLALVTLATIALAGSAAADDSGNFIYRLGEDTTSVEHYTRSASKLELDQAGRAPRTLRRRYTIDYKSGAVTHVAVVATAPGAPAPAQTVDATFAPDSMRMEVKNPAGAVVQRLTLVVPQSAYVVVTGSPWPCYEGPIMKLAQGKSDSLVAPLYLLGFPTMNTLTLRKMGKDSVDLTNDHLDHFHVRIDKSGHVLGVLPITGTAKFSANRVEKLDVDAYASAFMAKEQAGAGLGTLSPRDSVKIVAGGASLWIDYGRPAKRGRVVYGGVVPYGEVWRTGANAATQFRTDKALDFGGTVVPAGFYTLWTLPTASGWKLIVNSETGQWGTAHKPEKDLFTIDMKVSALPQVVERFTIGVDATEQGGTINLDWDTTRASATFTASK
jgi:DUF2911 family protein